MLALYNPISPKSRNSILPFTTEQVNKLTKLPALAYYMDRLNSFVTAYIKLKYNKQGSENNTILAELEGSTP
jgi:hypothetical protein